MFALKQYLCCKNWCRDWSETQGGKYPISDHAPGCENYNQEEFTRIENDDTACVMEPSEAEAMVNDSEEKYTVTLVMLTRDQFERMSDFTGF